jgi:gas vesicle protein
MDEGVFATVGGDADWLRSLQLAAAGGRPSGGRLPQSTTPLCARGGLLHVWAGKEGNAVNWIALITASLSSTKGDSIMTEENRSYGMAWFLAGLGVGALVGILYAPKSGRETRADICTGARESTEYLRTRSREAAEGMSTLVDKTKEQVNAFVDRGKEQMSDYVDRGREVIDRGRAQWEEFVEKGKNLVSDQASRVGSAVDAGRQAYKTSTATDASETHEY